MVQPDSPEAVERYLQLRNGVLGDASRAAQELGAGLQARLAEIDAPVRRCGTGLLARLAELEVLRGQ